MNVVDVDVDAPTLACRKNNGLTCDMSWNELDLAFADAEPVELGQAWNEVPESGFRPAAVRTLWSDTALFLYAVLEDDHIFNPVTRDNEPAFTEGDVFEIFLRPDGQDAYFEFHVNPRNQKFQLRVPSGDVFMENRGGGSIPAAWFIDDWKIVSRVVLEPDVSRWRVIVEIPFARTVESGPVLPGHVFHFSFSRYDYPGDGQKPVLSSTSPHSKVNFHRQQEWGRLTLGV